MGQRPWRGVTELGFGLALPLTVLLKQLMDQGFNVINLAPYRFIATLGCYGSLADTSEAPTLT